MNMCPLHKKLLVILENGKYTPHELAFILNVPMASVRARISELRNIGYNIALIDRRYAYTTNPIDETTFNQLLSENELWFKNINIRTLCIHLGVSKQELITFMERLQ